MIKDYLLKVRGGSSSLHLFTNQPPRNNRRKESRQVTQNIKMDISQNQASDENVILTAMRNKKSSINLAQKEKQERKVLSSQKMTEKKRKQMQMERIQKSGRRNFNEILVDGLEK